ncbi:hypothetical protein BH23CHL4_BH23CHL4_23390 [soil metagenome]
MNKPFSAIGDRLPSSIRTAFIGRESETDALVQLLTRPDLRLVTVTGPGGVGKTRLALHAAETYSQNSGVETGFVDFALVRDGLRSPHAVSRALGVQESPSQSLEDAFAAFLADRDRFLVFDNLEHVSQGAVDLISTLLHDCGNLKILCTSRSPLQMTAEQNFPVAPLATPTAMREVTAAAVERVAAIQLFVVRSRAVNPGFALTDANAADITAVCQMVDGLPLAVELAAAQTNLYSPSVMRDRLTKGLPVLANGPVDAPARLRSMRDAIAWSYDLLSENEQCVFRRLSVFVGGFTLDAANVVVADGDEGADQLHAISSLVNHSLLARDEHVTTGCRFRMLETVREFAANMLEACGETSTVEKRHARYFLSFVVERDPELVKFLPDSYRLLDELDADHANLMAALAWSERSGDCDCLAGLAGSLGEYWLVRGRLHEGREWLTRAERVTQNVTGKKRSSVLLALGGFRKQLGEHEQLLAVSLEALERCRDEGDAREIMWAAQKLGVTAVILGRFELAESLQNEVLAAATDLTNRPWALNARSSILGHLGNIAITKGDIDAAERYLTEAVDLQRQQGFEPGASHVSASHPVAFLGDVARARGDLQSAFDLYQQSLKHAWRFGDTRAIGFALGGIAGCLAAAGDWMRAAECFGACKGHFDSTGFWFDVHIMNRQRAFGLPEPWQRAADSFGNEEALASVVRSSWPLAIQPLPGLFATDSFERFILLSCINYVLPVVARKSSTYRMRFPAM